MVFSFGVSSLGSNAGLLSISTMGGYTTLVETGSDMRHTYVRITLHL